MKLFTSTSDTGLFELQDGLLLVGAVVVPAILVLVWALMFKKKRRYKYKFRRHSRENHPMNPTLAETRGLPPLRKQQNVVEQPAPGQPKS
jgi:hypothetical protein